MVADMTPLRCLARHWNSQAIAASKPPEVGTFEAARGQSFSVFASALAWTIAISALGAVLRRGMGQVGRLPQRVPGLKQSPKQGLKQSPKQGTE
jgi:hypothetical protein